MGPIGIPETSVTTNLRSVTFLSTIYILTAGYFTSKLTRDFKMRHTNLHYDHVISTVLRVGQVTVIFRCVKCDVALCVDRNCFEDYHTKTNL